MVVVIAILAAITIVSYNGITNRANSSAAASAAKQAAQKVLTYAAVNSDQYPSTLSDAGLTDSNTVYQYRSDNSSNPPSFCVTATTQNLSYFVSNTATSPTAGACPGHGINGGGVITNLAKTPVPTSLYSSQGWLTTFASPTLQPAGPEGRDFLRTTSTAVSAGSTIGVIQGTSTSTAANVTPGQYYTASAWIRVSDPTERANLRVRWKTATSTTISDLSSSASANDGGWYRLSVGGTAPANAAYVEVGMLNLDNSVNSGVSIDGTGVMVTTGNTGYNFGYGTSSGWVWNGASNSSTSTGPAL